MASKSTTRVLSMLAAVTLVAGCSKATNYQIQQAEYREQCFGDHSVRCRVMMVDLAVAQLEANIERFETLEDKVVSCRDRAAFDQAIALLEAKVDHLESLKPNIFMRTVLSGMEIEFNESAFPREGEAKAHFASLDQCLTRPAAKAAAVPAVPAVPDQPVRPSASTPGAFDSNSPDVTGPLTVTAGVLSKMALPDGREVMALNGKPLFQGDDAQWQSAVRVFKLSGEREAILMASSGGRGTSCETLFYFLLADRQGVRPTPLFGTCWAAGKFVQDGDRITLQLPKMGGTSTIVYDTSTLLEDGQPVALTTENDPSK